MEPRDRRKAQELESLYLALGVLGFFSNGQRERGITELARDFGVSKPPSTALYGEAGVKTFCLLPNTA